MSAMQEIQPAPSVAVDPQQYQQFSQSDVPVPQAFVPLVPAPHPDPTLPPDSAVHMHIPLPPPLFQQPLEPTAAVPISMHLPISSLNDPDAANAMDVVHPVTSQSGSPGIIPDLSTQSAMYGMDPRLAGLEAVDPSYPLLSSPSANSASTSASHASSPSLTGVTPAYSAGSSSLASALDHVGTARSRSGSVASPPNLTASGSDMGFPSAGSGPPTTVHESGFQFPPPGFENPLQTTNEPVQDVPGGAHLMVLGDMLKNIARTANSGSEACSMGQGGNATEIVSVLKKNVLLVAELVAAMQLVDPATAGSPSRSLGPGASSSLSVSSVPAPVADAMNVEQQPAAQQQHTPPSLNNLPSGGSMDLSTMSDSSESSRKRCASSVAGDRVVKAMKLEPQDEVPPLQMSSSTGVQSPMLPSTHFSYTYPLSNAPPPLSSVADMSAVPPPLSSAGTLSSSRPPSSSGLPPPLPLGLSLDATQQLVSSIHGAIPVESIPSLPHSPDFMPPSSATSGPLPSPPGFIPPGTVWSDNCISIPLSKAVPVAGPSTLTYNPAVYSPTRSTHLQQAPLNAASATLGRASRSASMSHLHGNPFSQVPDGVSHPTMYESTTQSRPSTSGRHSPPAESPEYDYDDGRDSDDEGEQQSHAEGHVNGTTRSHAGQRRMSRTSPSNEGGGSSGHGNEVPQEYRTDVERIFFEFLNSICSNLDATDSKGEPIHQTLMAKKMQRLDESPDFRPFKFRIQAFTNAFLEELARQGYPEEKIPMKKIRNFLWNQPYISRFNEEGKKSKSKGNHIWHVDAKKTEGGWTFRPFRRKLAGTPPGVAYVGLRWTWTPRIWDPQASRANMPVSYSSPALPPWLAWKEDSLTGIPPPEAQSCDVTVEARFIQDGKEELLTHTVHITIAPMAAVDSTFTPSRRPSLVGDIHNPRRMLSDSIVAGVSQPPAQRLTMRGSLVPVAAAPVVAPESQVVQVLTTAAQRVAQEAQSQVVASPNEVGPELQALAKQQHVLTVTAQAISSKMAGEVPEGAVAQSNALMAAAQQVVLQAARQVVADRTVAAVSSGFPPAVAVSAVPQVTVKEVSVATQSAVAQAVDMVGPLSSEVDVLMTAKSLLQQQTRAAPALIDPIRSHSTGSSPQVPFDLPTAPPVPVPIPPSIAIPPPGAVYYSS